MSVRQIAPVATVAGAICLGGETDRRGEESHGTCNASCREAADGRHDTLNMSRRYNITTEEDAREGLARLYEVEA